MIRLVAALLMLALTACGQDVVLGHHELAASDAALSTPDSTASRDAFAGPDATLNRFWPGLYQLTYGPEHETMCDPPLSGTESSYASITPESLDFLTGNVELVLLGPSTIRLDGAILEDPFGTNALVLQSGIEEAPEQFVAQRSRAATPGPEGTTTTLTAVMMQLDGSTATGRTAEGVVAVAYEAPDRLSACIIAIGVHATAIGL